MVHIMIGIDRAGTGIWKQEACKYEDGLEVTLVDVAHGGLEARKSSVVMSASYKSILDGIWTRLLESTKMKCSESKDHIEEERIFECSQRYGCSVDLMSFRIRPKCFGSDSRVVVQEAHLQDVDWVMNRRDGYI